jgi:hypothetical protein
MPAKAGRHAGQPDPVRRAAHDAVQDDNVGRRNSVRLLENVSHTERASSLEALLPRKLPRVRLIGGDELDNLSLACARSEQLGLDRPDPSTDL